MIAGRVEEVDDDQKRIHRNINEEMNEKAPFPLVGEDRFVPPGALKQERKVVGRDADAPTGKHPDEPDVARIAIKIERSKYAYHHHEDAEVDDKPPHSAILAHGPNTYPSSSPAASRTHNAAPRRWVYGRVPSRKPRM